MGEGCWVMKVCRRLSRHWRDAAWICAAWRGVRVGVRRVLTRPGTGGLAMTIRWGAGDDPGGWWGWDLVVSDDIYVTYVVWR